MKSNHWFQRCTFSGYQLITNVYVQDGCHLILDFKIRWHRDYESKLHLNIISRKRRYVFYSFWLLFLLRMISLDWVIGVTNFNHFDIGPHCCRYRTLPICARYARITLKKKYYVFFRGIIIIIRNKIKSNLTYFVHIAERRMTESSGFNFVGTV